MIRVLYQVSSRRNSSPTLEVGVFLLYEDKFSLGGITGSGSYRLVITVTKDQRTVMEVPYYFIVQ